jgi:hypothetical protein
MEVVSRSENKAEEEARQREKVHIIEKINLFVVILPPSFENDIPSFISVSFSASFSSLFCVLEMRKFCDFLILTDFRRFEKFLNF